ncbi:hypothetical protein HYX07_02180 [Candidatus Woesearchaeota archaeon]|nr:hypothetical protein [Candidatus Woesearchaeota archaeon]
MNKMQTTLLERGISVLYKELGPVEAVRFLQKLGVSKGDSVKEIESITEKFSRKEALERIRKYRK